MLQVVPTCRLKLNLVSISKPSSLTGKTTCIIYSSILTASFFWSHFLFLLKRTWIFSKWTTILFYFNHLMILKTLTKIWISSEIVPAKTNNISKTEYLGSSGNLKQVVYGWKEKSWSYNCPLSYSWNVAMFFSEHKSSFIGNRGWDELRERFRIIDFERIALNQNLDFHSNINAFCWKKELFYLLQAFLLSFVSTRCIMMQRIEVK